MDEGLRKRLPADMAKLREQLAQRIVGMDDVIDLVLTCLLCGGHGLLVGVPGLAKTMLCSSLAELLDLEFKRVQFTPDLMPSDIVGTETLTEQPEGGRGFRFVHGPIFTNLLLADEINRTPPKTQAALMEGMEEGTVTSGGELHALPAPFIVLATQNPIEQEGTYDLPAAQLDRFLVRIEVRYPDAADERRIVRNTTAGVAVDLQPILGSDEILQLQEIVRSTEAPDEVVRYATALARASRPGDDSPEVLEGLVAWGAGPRAPQALVLAAKARALMEGRAGPNCKDVRHVLSAVMRHRVIPSFTATARGIGTPEIVRLVRNSVSAPDGWKPPEPRRKSWLQRVAKKWRKRLRMSA